jgi:hypothetical protein
VHFLKSWLFKHILKEDKKYQEFCKKENIDLKPFCKELISLGKITIHKAQAFLYNLISDTNEVEAILNTDIVLKIINIWQTHNLSVNIPIIDLQHIWLIKMVVELDISVALSPVKKEKKF